MISLYKSLLTNRASVASLAVLRKVNEAAQPRQRMKTPQEFSHFKHERECKMQEKAELYKQQVIAQQRVFSSSIFHIRLY